MMYCSAILVAVYFLNRAFSYCIFYVQNERLLPKSYAILSAMCFRLPSFLFFRIATVKCCTESVADFLFVCVRALSSPFRMAFFCLHYHQHHRHTKPERTTTRHHDNTINFEWPTSYFIYANALRLYTLRSPRQERYT